MEIKWWPAKKSPKENTEIFPSINNKRITEDPNPDLLYSVERLGMSFCTEAGYNTVVLNNLNIDIPSGELICIQGGNGSGKTTFLHILAGVHAPTTGLVKINIDSSMTPINFGDKKLTTYIRQKESIEILQAKNLVSFMSVMSNIVMPIRLRGDNLHVNTVGSIYSLAREFGIYDYINCKPNSLSGGQQQLAAVIRALSSGHRIILADEPTASLDQHNKARVMKKLKEHCQKKGNGAIIITHDIDIAEEYCDRFISFVPHQSGGYTAISGRSNPRTTYVR